MIISRKPERSKLVSLTGWLILLLITEPTAASETRYLLRNEVFCSTNKEICIHGTLSFEVNPHLLRLRGRVQSATGPGLLRILLVGTNQLGHRGTTEMELSLRGNHSEIINYKMIPDYPDIDNWEIISISIELDENYRGQM